MIEARDRETGGWRGEIRPPWAGPGDTGMTTVDKTATGLVIAGAINWGLMGLARLDLVRRLLGGKRFGETSALTRLAYLLVGAAGGYGLRRLASTRR